MSWRDEPKRWYSVSKCGCATTSTHHPWVLNGLSLSGEHVNTCDQHKPKPRNNPMTDITPEQRARELLAAEFRRELWHSDAAEVMAGEGDQIYGPALRAIEAALRLSAGADWVSVADRLPERPGLGAVLAFDSARPEKDPWVETLHPSWWGKPYDHVEEVGPTITHWQPLPAAPRHESGEGL